MSFPLLAFDGAEGWRPGIRKAGMHGQAGQEPPNEQNNILDDDAVAREPLAVDNLTLGRDKIHKQIFVSLRQYWRSLMQHRGESVTGWLSLSFAELNPSTLDYHWLWQWRNLAELFTIVTSNLIERREIEETKKAYEKHRKETPQALRDYLQRRVPIEGEDLGSVFINPPSVKGSRADMQGHYGDYMALCSEKGDPQM